MEKSSEGTVKLSITLRKGSYRRTIVGVTERDTCS